MVIDDFWAPVTRETAVSTRGLLVVALVEGSSLRAAGLGALLAAMAPEVTVVAVRRSVADCHRAIDTHRPDIVIFDVRAVCPELAALLRSLRLRDHPVTSLAILATLEPLGVRRLFGLGLGGLLSTDLEPEDLLNALRVLRTGRMVLDPVMLTQPVTETAQPSPAIRSTTHSGTAQLGPPRGGDGSTTGTVTPGTPAGRGLNGTAALGTLTRTEPARAELTRIELTILRLAAQGMGNDEMARRLTMSASTLKRNLRVAIAKLAARDRTSAVATAVRAGLI